MRKGKKKVRGGERKIEKDRETDIGREGVRERKDREKLGE